MPEAWSNKDERQYRKIRESARKRGQSKDRAEEIAARTVNKTRRKENRAPNKSSKGTGNPTSQLEDRTVRELRNRAAELNIEGRSKMGKDDLIRQIRKRS